MLATPRSTPIGNANQALGANAMSVIATPYANDANATTRTLMVLRRAVRSAPINAPTLTVANNSVNVVPFPP